MRHVRETHLYRAGWALLLVLVLGVALLLAGCGGLGAAAGPKHPPLPASTPRPAPFTPTPQPAVVLDTDGTRLLDAHDGHVVRDGATYYQFGTAYACGFKLLDPASPWCGVRVFSSPDMATWTDRGLAFDPAAWQSRCSQGSFGCFRPHVAQRGDGSWVMWLNVASSTGWSYGVLTAPTVLGPWTERPTPVVGSSLPAGLEAGDHDITVDPSGTAWLAYTIIGAGNSHDIAVERLDPTMTTGTGQTVVVGLTMVEAPALFLRGSTWYLAFSDPACPYCGGTGTGYVTAPSPLGPWSAQGLRITDTSCGGQPAAVNELPGGIYQFQSDLWQQLPGGSFDPNQALAPTYTEALRFDAAGGILPLTCAG